MTALQLSFFGGGERFWGGREKESMRPVLLGMHGWLLLGGA